MTSTREELETLAARLRVQLETVEARLAKLRLDEDAAKDTAENKEEAEAKEDDTAENKEEAEAKDDSDQDDDGDDTAARSASYRARIGRLQLFCSNCDGLLPGQDYKCWVCGRGRSFRWGWDDNRGVVVCSSGDHVDGKYVQCRDVAQKIMPKIELGGFSPKAVYGCDCPWGRCGAPKDHVTDDLDVDSTSDGKSNEEEEHDFASLYPAALTTGAGAPTQS